MIELVEARSIKPGDRVKHSRRMSAFVEVTKIDVLPDGYRQLWLSQRIPGTTKNWLNVLAQEQVWRHDRHE
jgi:hypothetical protein